METRALATIELTLVHDQGTSTHRLTADFTHDDQSWTADGELHWDPAHGTNVKPTKLRNADHPEWEELEVDSYTAVQDYDPNRRTLRLRLSMRGDVPQQNQTDLEAKIPYSGFTETGIMTWEGKGKLETRGTEFDLTFKVETNTGLKPWNLNKTKPLQIRVPDYSSTMDRDWET